MGNPHAVIVVDDLDKADVVGLGAALGQHGCFPQGVNVGFMQVVARNRVSVFASSNADRARRLPAVPAPAQRLLAAASSVFWNRPSRSMCRGGTLTIAWQGDGAPVLMTGPATTVYDGILDLPDHTH